jgi:L-ascorbate metabolism protein UlaG (beta-lactamase superfamily)
MRSVRSVVIVALVALAVLFMAAWYERPGLGEYHDHLIPRSTPAHPVALRATWLGTSALLLQDGRNAILIDPFFTRPAGLIRMALNRRIAPDEALIKRWLDRLEVKSLDAVLVSHTHFDHAMDAGVVARLTGARLAGSESTLNVGRGAGLDAARLLRADPAKPLQFGGFTVHFVPSAHAGATGGRPSGDITAPLTPPAHYMDYKQGGTYSLLIEHAQGKVLHHGSAGFVPPCL